AVRLSQLLTDEVTALERTGRQYAVLGEPSLLKDYAGLRARFQSIVDELSSLLPAADMQKALAQARQAEAELFESLQKKPRAADRRHLEQGYADLAGHVLFVRQASNVVVVEEAERLRASAE